MKKNLALTFLYFVYLGAVMFVDSISSSVTNDYNSNIKATKQEVPLAKEEVAILHSELLFNF